MPGLEGEIEVAAGSRMLVLVHYCVFNCVGGGEEARPALEVDGVQVQPEPGSLLENVHWLSEPLSAGTHSARMVVSADDGPGPNLETECVGGRPEEPSFFALIEIRQ
jgi:hypothetical protein